MRNRHFKQKNAAAIFRHVWEKRETCLQIGIEPRLYSKAGFWGTNLQLEFLKPVPNKAFHSLAPGVEEIPDWQANRGLCSIRAIVILLPNNPVTTLFSGAFSSLAGRLNFLGYQSQRKTVARTSRNSVFAYTQNRARHQDLTCRKAKCVG
jgi:hypothetical protein